MRDHRLADRFGCFGWICCRCMVVFCALFLGAPPSIAQEVIQSASELDSPPHSIVTLAVLGALVLAGGAAYLWLRTLRAQVRARTAELAIANRQQQEEIRRREQSEARFRDLFEQNSSVMLLIEPASGAIVDANRSAVEFYGYARDELLQMSKIEGGTSFD